MEIVILLYKGFTALDVIGPYEVLCRLPGAVIKFAAKQKGIVESEYRSMKVIATHSLAEIETADILLIPGSTTAFLKVMEDGETIYHVQRINNTTQWTVSVCSGALILTAAGLLKDKSATTHWALLNKLETFGALPVSARYVQAGKIITAAGVSAGIDMALYLTSIVAGEEYAKMLQLVTEYYPEPPISTPDLSTIPKTIEASAMIFLKAETMKMSRTFVTTN